MKTKRNETAVGREHRTTIVAMRKAGVSVLKIARVLEVSPQTVYWHLNRLREEGVKV